MSQQQEQEAETSAAAAAATTKSPSEMRIKEIKAELQGMNIAFADCFDKESLVQRLLDARDGTIAPPKPTTTTTTTAPSTTTTTTQKSQPSASSASSSSPSFDMNATKADLRKKKILELRTALGTRGIRWAHMIEKEEMVVALANALEQESHFSLSGQLQPGKATDISEDVLEQELSSSGTPLLLDVYATWCGPCKMMAPQLEEAAAVFGSNVRVAKMDSDANQEWASKLRVSGLPTIILFSKDGKELKRQEGAMMKDMIINFVEEHT